MPRKIIMNYSMDSEQLLNKYRKFVYNLANIIDVQYANVVDKERLTKELLNAIENDCVNLESIEKWVTCEYVHTFTQK
jgi:hypothetical protein